MGSADGYLLALDIGTTTTRCILFDLTGKAMALAADVVFVAGAPLVFNLDDLAATYEGRCGGLLWATSAKDGSQLAEYPLDALPAWDSMAAAYGKLFIVNQDGSVACWGTNSDEK